MYLKAVKRVDLKSSHHKKKKFVTMWSYIAYNNHFMIQTYYVTNVKLMKCLCQLYINKVGGVLLYLPTLYLK